MAMTRACVGSSVPAAMTIGGVADASCTSVLPSHTTVVAPVCNTDKGKAVDAVTTMVNSPTDLDIPVFLDMGAILLTAHSSGRRPFQLVVPSPADCVILGTFLRKTGNTKCYATVQQKVPVNLWTLDANY